MRAILSLTLVLMAALPACGGDAASTDRNGESVAVVASFYPLAFVAERVGGDRVTVTNLTPPGVEPHDLELTPDDLEAIAAADVVIDVGGGFQPSVEEAVAAEASGITIDALAGAPALPGQDGGGDPHMWLDPARVATLADRVGEALTEADPAGATVFGDRAAALRADLEALDREFRDGLASCRSRVLITNHAAFGYLAAAYDLDQRAISGLSPEAEPDPGRIAELAAEAERDGVTTVFTEELVSAEVAETLATEAGLTTAVLSPLEGLSEERAAAGEDYLSVMRANLEVMRDGLGCT
jgi:zinc transport system substrate-binding protein